MTLEPEALPERKTHFTAVSEAEIKRRGRAGDAEESLPRNWITAGVLLVGALVILGSVVIYAIQPPSADSLYRQVQKAAEQGGPALVGVESEMGRFLALHPGDPRADEIRSWQQDLELYRLERRFELRARRSDGVADLLPIERAYFEAQQLIARDPEAALARMQAIVAVFGNEPDASLNKLQQAAARQTLELARKQAEALEKTVEQFKSDERLAIKQQLERANQLAVKDRQAATQIWQGIVTLYGEKAWAKDLVEQAAANLAD
jgi:serine/threonine-protein kinase